MRYLPLFLFIFLISCNNSEEKLTAQQIIDKTIAYSGADKVANSVISYNFRNVDYLAERNNGIFKLTRSFEKDSVLIEDILTNTNFERLIDDEIVNLDRKVASKYTNSVNSVHYFSVLPFGLNDKAVHKKLLKSSTVKGKEYYKVEITFSEDGGGEDFEDVFIYWVGKEDFLIDYLAYSYHTNDGGKRFRVLKEQCVKNGVRFVDYHNYKPLNKDIKLIDIDKAYEENQLKKVSEIVLKDIEVIILE
ncbi:deoxyribose-phosphate aldolase [Polaribacter pectinis]|uniref:Deoxyribose-phosphate aldolase n=2 Tax=Polaribacter pectinis TaxID=2738844 RepID=A0A7G9LEK8_9FLAO|nr:deoxyribose-phosphate aldolase [Polaribacter pectinis]